MDPRWDRETPTDPILNVFAEPSDARRALRRAALVPCELCSHYGDVPEAHVASDVSPFGMWIDTEMPLHPGAEVVVCFQPPRREDGPELRVFATVTRVTTGRRRRDRGRLGMAVEFTDLSGHERAALEQSLRGIAPRLDRKRLVS